MFIDAKRLQHSKARSENSYTRCPKLSHPFPEPSPLGRFPKCPIKFNVCDFWHSFGGWLLLLPGQMASGPSSDVPDLFPVFSPPDNSPPPVFHVRLVSKRGGLQWGDGSSDTNLQQWRVSSVFLFLLLHYALWRVVSTVKFPCSIFFPLNW